MVVIEQGRAKRVSVETGAIGAKKIEILRGLADDAAIVRDDPDRFKDGQTVRTAP